MKSKVFIITGFLGSGKTTLLKRILESAKDLSGTVVLVNEFGKVGIDGALIKNTAAANIVELNSGCICCSLKLDMIQTLQLLWEKYAPERVIIEATGVADPLAIIETLADRMLTPHFRHEKTIMVIAGDFWEARHMFKSVFKSQLNQADLILLNKIDTLDKSAIPVILKQVQEMSVKARVIPTFYSNIDPNILWAGSKRDPQDLETDLFFKAYDPEKDFYAPGDDKGRSSAKEAGFITFLYETSLPLDRKMFIEFIGTVPLELFRIKGPVRFDNQTEMLNFVGGKSEWIKWPDHITTCLTFIGWDVKEDPILKKLNNCISRS